MRVNSAPQTAQIAALIELHRGLCRQGPGDAGFTRALLRSLPALPAKPRIADLGCGTGAGTLVLADCFQCQVTAVDSSAVFIEELKINARRAGLDHLVVPICADMAALAWPPGSIDLLWSEGAAYNLGFEQALRVWRPLLATGGIAVLSELSWFKEERPEPALAFWQDAYPDMGSESQNIIRAGRAGFKVAFTRRLPTRAWWKNYYEPLRAKIKRMEATPANREVIRETEQEMALFERYSDDYGYTFYVLRTCGPDFPGNPA